MPTPLRLHALPLSAIAEVSDEALDELHERAHMLVGRAQSSAPVSWRRKHAAMVQEYERRARTHPSRDALDFEPGAQVTPAAAPLGPLSARLAVVTALPSESSVKQRHPLSDERGDFLRAVFKEMGIDPVR